MPYSAVSQAALAPIGNEHLPWKGGAVLGAEHVAVSTTKA